MSSIYQIPQDYISNTINALYNGDYLNCIAMMQAFRVFTKTIHPKLQKKVVKNLQLFFNKILDLEQE